MLDVRRSHPLWMRGVAALLAMMFFIGLSTVDTIAQEAELYEQVTTATWGNDGQVTNYTYDANGSLVRKVITRNGAQTTDETFDYNLENRLSRHTKTTVRDTETIVSTTDYTYNHEGIKVRSHTVVTVDGVVQPDLEENQIFLVDSYNHTGYSQIVETRSDYGGVPTVSYTIGDDVLSQTKLGQGTDYLLYDGHGSTRQLADATGAVTAQYTYDAYGVMVAKRDPNATQPSTTLNGFEPSTSLLYCGEQYDTGLQNYYLRARHYDQSNGRFNRLDPFGGNHHDPQSLHKYAYCHGDPVNGVDPSGEMNLVAALLLVLIVVVLFQVAYDLAQPHLEAAAIRSKVRRTAENAFMLAFVKDPDWTPRLGEKGYFSVQITHWPAVFFFWEWQAKTFGTTVTWTLTNDGPVEVTLSYWDEAQETEVSFTYESPNMSAIAKF